MNELTKAYEKCRRKFLIHMDRMDTSYLCELMPCQDGDYYAHPCGCSLSDTGNWMTSFMTGMAPLFYQTEKDKKYLLWADRMRDQYMNKVTLQSMQTMHDLGFLYCPYSIAMYNQTGDRRHQTDALYAADILAKRFVLKGHFIEAWNRMDRPMAKGRLIIDTMMNLSLLLWAWEQTGHRFYKEAAEEHTETVLKYLIRKDGSVVHSCLFDMETGAYLTEDNTCGYSNGSYWSRGTAWAIYGFTIMAKHLNEQRYSDTARYLLNKYCSELTDDNGIPAWDFRLPEASPALGNDADFKAYWDESASQNKKLNVDTSACAIASCALLELARLTGEGQYEKLARKWLTALCSEDYFNHDERLPGMLSHQNGRMQYTMYGDFFFVQALQMLIYDSKSPW